MAKRKHPRINVPLVKTYDDEDRYLIDSLGIQSTFDPEGTLTFNGNNGVLTWNSGDITNINITGEDFLFLYNAETGLITLTVSDKNIWFDLQELKKMILEKGMTIEEMEAKLAKQGQNNEGANIKNEETLSDSGHAE